MTLTQIQFLVRAYTELHAQGIRLTPEEMASYKEAVTVLIIEGERYIKECDEQVESGQKMTKEELIKYTEYQQILDRYWYLRETLRSSI